MKQVIIIGSGPSGISASIYLKRSGITPLVIGKDEGILKDAYDINNYYGFVKPISGIKLFKDGIKQAKNIGVDIIKDTVIYIKDEFTHFTVITKKGLYQARSIVIATGRQRASLKIPGFMKYKGKGISFCATCDGFLYKNKKIGLIGYSDYMFHELECLKSLTNNITIFTDGNKLTRKTNFKVVETMIDEFVGNDKITHIVTNNQKYAIDGVFIALDSPSVLEFSSQLGIALEKGSISIDSTYQTNIPGVFAIGDVIGGKMQIAKAVYDGMMVADFIKKYLENNK